MVHIYAFRLHYLVCLSFFFVRFFMAKETTRVNREKGCSIPTVENSPLILTPETLHEEDSTSIKLERSQVVKRRSVVDFVGQVSFETSKHLVFEGLERSKLLIPIGSTFKSIQSRNSEDTCDLRTLSHSSSFSLRFLCSLYEITTDQSNHL